MFCAGAPPFLEILGTDGAAPPAGDPGEHQLDSPGQQAQQQLCAGVGLEGHLAEDGEDAGSREDREHRESPHLHGQLVLRRTAPQHELGDRDQDVDEQDHRARGVQRTTNEVLS
jgi:hypothetical protein